MAEGTRIFVGNLSWNTNDDSLWQAFESVGGSGSVTDAKVITDKYTGRSRGFGFVTFGSPDQASAAMSRMDGAEVDGRPIRVDIASSRQRD